MVFESGAKTPSKPQETIKLFMLYYGILPLIDFIWESLVQEIKAILLMISDNMRPRGLFFFLLFVCLFVLFICFFYILFF